MKSFLLGVAMLAGISFADDLITLFPLENYDQNVNSWIKPNDVDYESSLVSQDYQQQKFADFYSHYYSSAVDGLSPWSRDFVNQQLSHWKSQGVIAGQVVIFNSFYTRRNQPEYTGYGENFRPYPDRWYQDLAANMNLSAPELANLGYSGTKRAIAIANACVRSFPTQSPLFYSHAIAGQGFPFDNLQQSAIFIGMPLYIVSETRDKAWSLVISSDDVGWIPSTALAKVNDGFIRSWQHAARNGLIAITKEHSLVDNNGLFRGTAYNGSSFPLSRMNIANAKEYSVLVPMARGDGYATTVSARLPFTAAAKMPLALTPHNMARLIQNQIGKPYGWGSMYFNYDCSAEMKALFAPFGFYLPRNSADQVSAGSKVAILDKLSTQEREQYLLAHGRKWLTLIQIPGHILLYMGSYPNPFSSKHEPVALSYQNVWGLRTRENSSRAVIGGSVIFPLLLTYPENDKLVSFYDDKVRRQFRLIYLSEE